MAFNIRPLAQDDRDTWEALFGGYAEFYKTQVSAAAKEAVWDWIFDPENDFWCDLAVDGHGRAAGFTQYQFMHRSLSGEMVCYLSDLYVCPGARGMGIGRALIDRVIAFARKRGISNVRWLTQEFNYNARALYDTYRPRSDFILYSIPTDRNRTNPE